MNLPTELRIEIFSQLFQEAHKDCNNELHFWPYSSMPAYSTPTFSMSHPNSEYALLGVNQQLRNEAEYALSTSTTSVAQIGAPSIRFLNKSWISADWDRFQQRLYCSSSACNLPVTMTKRIRNIKIYIGLGAYGMGSRDRLGKLTVQNHTEEDAGLYAVRANVRKLVEMISCTDANGKQVHSLQNLTITVHGSSTTYSWPQDKVLWVLRFVLEPFTALYNVGNPEIVHIPEGWIAPRSVDDLYAKEWCRKLQRSPPRGQDVDQDAVWQPLLREASAELNKIENVVRVILEHDSPWRKHAASSIRWTPISSSQQLQYHTFCDINDVMHLARVCCEIGDVTSLIAIQKAFREAWVFRQIKPQPETLSVANATMALGDVQEPSGEYHGSETTKLLPGDRF
jgi:hypothetical protein